MLRLIAIVAMLLAAIGCVTMSDYRADYLAANPDTPERFAAAIEEGAIMRGMTKQQVVAAWGPPVDINRSVGSWGAHEQWVYGAYSRYSTRRYVYFEGNRCTGWQD